MTVLVTRLAAGLVALATLLLAIPGHAQTWTTHELAGVTFEVPADWLPVSERKHAVILADANGQELRVEWFFQDEPFLGYDDIVADKRITVEGKRATWKHSAFPERQGVAILFDEKRQDGRQLLMSLEVPGRDAAGAIGLFDDMLSRVRFAGTDGAGAAQRSRPPALSPEVPLSPQMSVVAEQYGDCDAVDLSVWAHPTLDVVRVREGARLEWAMLCRSGTFPVFGMSFDYDPFGRREAISCRSMTTC